MTTLQRRARLSAFAPRYRPHDNPILHRPALRHRHPPHRAMRAAMAAAAVGDDQYGEDPTMNALQERVAALLGKEAALWLPSGTMANQVALRAADAARRRCDRQPRVPRGVARDRRRGRQRRRAVHRDRRAAASSPPRSSCAACKPRDHPIYPPTDAGRNREHAQPRGRRHLSAGRGACGSAPRRASAGSPRSSTARGCGTPRSRRGRRLRELAAPFDLVAVSLSKGLGAPGGSLLAGSTRLIEACVRHRRMLGGAMRQVGIFAAAGALRARPSHGAAASRTTRTRARSPSAWRRAAACNSILRRCRRTSSCSVSPPMHRMRGRWSRGRASVAC